ncbi:OB-fold nucleic acid binding domain-containing protein [Candidatus Woesearchaeota archaeon]|nr:OB-fold nucleic acid binding domain-containing protein [Candidatus Woesearchaeota archaeon]
MNESSIFKLSLAISLTGILLLLVIVETTEIQEIGIEDISNKKEDETVRIVGKIESIKETPGLYILNIEDKSGKINVIVFKEDKLNISKGNQADIEGTVKEYQNKKELIAKRISII